jgi:hypothetical protein
MVRARSLLVGCVTAEAALLDLLLGACLHLVPPQLAAVAPDLARVAIHENRHFCGSSSTGCEGCEFGGVCVDASGTDRSGEGKCQSQLTVNKGV